MPRSADGPRQAGTIAAGAFDAERLNPPVCVGPPEQGLISARIGDERVIAQAEVLSSYSAFHDRVAPP